MTEPNSTPIYCACGCGQLAPIATKTNTSRGVRKGDVIPYRRGHHVQTPELACNCGCNLTRRECAANKLAEHREWWESTYPGIPYGICACGCGRKTSFAPETNSEKGWVKGAPRYFKKGHHLPKPPKTTHGVNRTDGLCECGCGHPAPISGWTGTREGWVRGKPRRFLPYHASPHFSRILRREAYFVDERTGCWVWQLGRNPDGYGLVWHEGQCWTAHRLSYTLTKGSIPVGTEIDHLCGNRACANPEHLEAVTHTENIRRGAHSKLTMADAQDIRTLYATGRYKQTDLATLYEVHLSTIHNVIRERTWKE